MYAYIYSIQYTYVNTCVYIYIYKLVHICTVTGILSYTPPAIKWKKGTHTTPESLRLLFLYLGISQSWSSTK